MKKKQQKPIYKGNLGKIQDKIQNIIDDILEKVNSIDQEINQIAIDFVFNGIEESRGEIQEKIKFLNSKRDMFKEIASTLDDSKDEPGLDMDHIIIAGS